MQHYRSRPAELTMKKAMPSSAPVVNKALADLLASEPNPMEQLAADQVSAKGVWAIGLAETDLLKHGRVVKLACGHFAITKALHKARCPRCGEMIRAGYDYDAFRHLGAPDEFVWPSDPFRSVHEPDTGPQHWSPIG